MESTDTKQDSKTDAASSSTSKLNNLAQETRGLVADLKEWVDIKIKLLQLDVEERIEDAVRQVISIVLVLILVLFTILFILIGVAEFLGSWLESTAYGYLIVGSVLAVATILINASRKPLSKKTQKQALKKRIDAKKTERLPEATPESSQSTPPVLNQ